MEMFLSLIATCKAKNWLLFIKEGKEASTRVFMEPAIFTRLNDRTGIPIKGTKANQWKRLFKNAK